MKTSYLLLLLPQLIQAQQCLYQGKYIDNKEEIVRAKGHDSSVNNTTDQKVTMIMTRPSSVVTS